MLPRGETIVNKDDFEQRMHAWRDAENAACAAEDKLRQVGQAASDPAMMQLVLQARDLRASADAMLSALVAGMNDGSPER